jgi:hypothetical protein
MVTGLGARMRDDDDDLKREENGKGEEEKRERNTEEDESFPCPTSSFLAAAFVYNTQIRFLQSFCCTSAAAVVDSCNCNILLFWSSLFWSSPLLVHLLVIFFWSSLVTSLLASSCCWSASIPLFPQPHIGNGMSQFGKRKGSCESERKEKHVQLRLAGCLESCCEGGSSALPAKLQLHRCCGIVRIILFHFHPIPGVAFTFR